MEMVDLLNMNSLVDLVPFGIKKFKDVIMHGLSKIVVVRLFPVILNQVSGNRLTHKAQLAHQATHGKNKRNQATHNHNNHHRRAKVVAGKIK